MCEHGDTVRLTINSEPVGIDRCIAPIVRALNDAGTVTIASCCGHGHQPSSIILRDGREIRICTYEQARQFDKLFPDIHGECAPATEGSGLDAARSAIVANVGGTCEVCGEQWEHKHRCSATEGSASPEPDERDAMRYEWKVCETCGKDFQMIAATNARRKAKPCICFECWRDEDRARPEGAVRDEHDPDELERENARAFIDAWAWQPSLPESAIPVEVGKGKQGIHGEWEAPIRGDDPVTPGEYWLIRATEGSETKDAHADD